MPDFKVALLLLSVLLYVEAVPYYVSCPYSDPFDRTLFFPHETNCHLYYKCDHGRVLKEDCPADLHWNPKLNTCDWPWHAGCDTSGTGSGGEGSGGTGSSGSGSEGTGSSGSGGEASGGSGSLPPGSCPVPYPGYIVYLPDPNDCTIFYECSFGEPVQINCPDGLHFNPTAHVCDLPELAGCSNNGEIQSTPEEVQTTAEEIETTPQPPHTTVPTEEPTTSENGGGSHPPVSCPVPDPGYIVYLPDPNDCSIFYECSSGVPVQFSCPAGTHFNPTAHVCDLPELAGCSNNGEIQSTPGEVQTTAEEIETTPQPPHTTVPTEEPTTSENGGGSHPPVSCPVPDPGYTVYLPDPNDCTIFYECTRGEPVQFSCPAGTHFNPTAHVCDLPELAGCSNNGEIQSTPGEVQTTAEEIETTPQPPHTTVPTEEPTTSENGGGSHPPVSCPVPDPGYTVYLPDPNDCTIFYECTRGEPVQFSCPAGTHFNPTAHVCDLPELAGCSNNGEIQSTPGEVQTTAEEIETTPQPPHTTVPTEEPTTSENGGGSHPPVSCPVPDPGYTVYLPDPNDCTIFYECTRGEPVQFSCPAGTHFNPTAHVCDLPELAGCSNNGEIQSTPGEVQTTAEEIETTPQPPHTTVPTEEPTTAENGGGSHPPVSCPVPDPGYIVYLPDPNDCSIFYECSSGVPVQFSCPAGTQFNPTAHVCDTLENAGCSHSGVIHTTPGGFQTTVIPTEEPTTPGREVTDSGNGGGEGNVSLPPNSCPDLQSGYTVYLPDPNDCSIFYECSFGVPYQLSCPVGLHFNPTAHVCDTPEHAGCSHSGVIHTTPGGLEIETTAGEIETSPHPPSTIFPTDNPGDQTTSGSAVTNDPASICPTAPEPSCPYTTPDVSVFFPHSTDNHFFFHCSYGVPYCKICPEGLIWHQELQRCDF